MAKTERNSRISTRCAQGQPAVAPVRGELVPAIHTSVTYEFEDQASVDRYYESGEGYLYSRYGNPTVDRVEALLADLEGAEAACAFSSGMAAISALVLVMAGKGGRIAAQRELYGGTAHLFREELPRLGVEVVWLDREELAELPPSRIEGCRLVYLESPINPTLRLIDLAAVASRARAAGVPTAVDATFASPALCRPLESGIDFVVHSATKYLGGHGDLLGGVVAGSAERIHSISLHRRAFGAMLDPFSAYLLHRGLATLPLRMEAHCRGAGRLASWLATQPGVERVFYPGAPDHPDHALAGAQMDGFGGMVSLNVSGGAAGAARLHDRLRLFARAGSLGGAHSLVSLPARMSHRYVDEATRTSMGVPPQMVRLSVGLEDPEDLLDDLEQALGD